MQEFCYPVAQVKIVSASLDREGFSAFSVEGEDADNRRFLKRTYSYQCGVMQPYKEILYGQNEILWTSYKDSTSIEETVDPFTGLVCRAGDVHYAPHPSNIGAVSKTEDEEQRSPTFKRYDYSWDCPQCEGSGIAQFEEIQLSDEYDDAAVEANLDTLLNNHNFTDIPDWDVSGEVIPGTDGDSALSLRQAPTGQSWKAEHAVAGDTIRKTKIQVRFLAPATYTVSTEAHLNPRDGEVRQAQKGEVVTFNAPAEPGAYFQVHACQALTACLYPSSTHETDTSASEIVDGIEDDCPYELNARYIGGDGKRYRSYSNYRTDNNTRSLEYRSISDFDFDSGDRNIKTTRDGTASRSEVENMRTRKERTCEEAIIQTGTRTTTHTKSGSEVKEDTEDGETETISQDDSGSWSTQKTCDDGSCNETENNNDAESFWFLYSFGDAPNAVYFSEYDPSPDYPTRCNCEKSYSGKVSKYFPEVNITLEWPGTETRTIECDETTRKYTYFASIPESGQNGSSNYETYLGTGTATITATASAEKTFITEEALEDPAETKVNYPKSIIPNDEEDGNRDGETCASVEYSGSRRTETSVDSMDVSVDVVISFTNPQNYRTYIAWVVSELDESDPNCPQLKISQESQLIDNRYVKEGSYTVSFAKNQPVGSTEDGKTKCVTSVESYVVTDWEIV